MDVNQWFVSLPPERQAVLREDKWMLANAAAQASAEAEREACAVECDLIADNAMSVGEVQFADVCAAAIRERSASN